MDIMDRSRRFVSELIEVNGQSFSRIVELQAGSLQRLADANRVRVRALREADGAGGVLEAQRDWYGMLGRTARDTVREQFGVVRENAQRSGAVIRDVVRGVDRADGRQGGAVRAT